jgi:MoaA/NifB/PqqE/SkfB family radical SAM enzyme
VIVSGWPFRRVIAAFIGRVILTAARAHGVRGSIRALRGLRTMVTATRRGNRLRKVAGSGGRYTFDIYAPAFPSPAGSRFLEQEIRRNVDRTSGNVLQTAIVAITKECPLRCEHCCEWADLNRPDTLSRDALRGIVDDLQKRGVTQIFFSGGEPLRRLSDLLHAAAQAAQSVDCWVITSGVGLTRTAAAQLAAARFTGVVISVDHWDPAGHDAFRGRRGVFDAAMSAAAHARAAGLLVAFSLCPTRELASRDHLERYAAMARAQGAAFIQIMEPRQVGHYEGRDVLLEPQHLAELEAFSDWMNFDPANDGGPIVTYPALYQRRHGCMGAAERYLYVDTNGDAHACPFCRKAAANVVRDGLDAAICGLRERGCPAGSVLEDGARHNP